MRMAVSGHDQNTWQGVLGRKLAGCADQLIRTAYFDEEGEDDKEFAMDYICYMWCGPEAPLFDKDKMATSSARRKTRRYIKKRKILYIA